MKITAYQLAGRFVGTKEIAGSLDNPMILSMLKLDNDWPKNDEVPWCSAFVNYIAWLLRLPRSKSLAARSWLDVGEPIGKHDLVPEFDIVVLSRGTDGGHVGFFAESTSDSVSLLGGNQGDKVCIASFPLTKVLGYRRLYNG